MPRWTITPVWKDRDCVIIGGGPSLTNFDWSLLEKENTIGCNTAFILGEKVCKVCVFGDDRWWKKYQFELAKYQGTVFTNCSQLMKTKILWLWAVDREARGLHTDRLGWNGNTGAVAINLAILFGAKRIYLLGFDMKRTLAQSNWHNQIIDKNAVRDTVYLEFARQFKFVHHDWKAKFPNVEIWNVTKDSGLSPDIFPWIDVDAWVESRKHIG